MFFIRHPLGVKAGDRISGIIFRILEKRIRSLPGNDEVSRDEKRAVVETLTLEFKDRLFEIVPAAEAERIVDGMDQARAKAEAARRAKGDQ